METKGDENQAVGRSESNVWLGKTCQHKLGHYTNKLPGNVNNGYDLCGRKATHVAFYPNRDPSYFCKKHSKSRSNLCAIPNII